MEKNSMQSPIVVHCHLRWDFVWQRPQQIFSRLAARHPVLFVEDAEFSGEQPELKITEPYPNVVRVVPVLPASAQSSVEDQCALVQPLLEAALEKHPSLSGRFDA